MSTSVLVEAIESRREVSFTYDGQPRTVQPAAVGIHVSTGNAILRGYQVAGTSNSRAVPLWDLFLLEKIEGGLVVEDSVFTADPPNYRRGDKHMGVIHAEL